MTNGYVARDADGALFFYTSRPPRRGKRRWTADRGPKVSLKGGMFPEVSWDDRDPTAAALVLTEDLEFLRRTLADVEAAAAAPENRLNGTLQRVAEGASHALQYMGLFLGRPDGR